MSRPRDIRNPFDWKRSAFDDLRSVGAITEEEWIDLHKLANFDEDADRIEGQRELAALDARLAARPWWRRALNWP